MSVMNRAMQRWEEHTIKGDAVNWDDYLHPDDVSRIVPADSIGEQAKESLLTGSIYQDGMRLPWGKTHSDVVIKQGKLAIWTGWSRHGKSQMLKMLELHSIGHGERWIVASMEEEIADIWIDMAIMYAGNDNPSKRMLDEFSKYISGKLWFYDQQGMVSAKRMQAVLRYAGTQIKTTQATVDSLMMLAMDRDDYDVQSRFVGELKSLAKDTHQTVHLVAHMRKREGKGGEEQPGNMHDIAGGHEISSKADYVFNVWRNMQKKNDMDHDSVLTVDKQRGRGRMNWIGRIGLNYHKASGQFVDGRQPMEFKL